MTIYFILIILNARWLVRFCICRKEDPYHPIGAGGEDFKQQITIAIPDKILDLNSEQQNWKLDFNLGVNLNWRLQFGHEMGRPAPRTGRVSLWSPAKPPICSIFAKSLTFPVLKGQHLLFSALFVIGHCFGFWITKHFGKDEYWESQHLWPNLREDSTYLCSRRGGGSA